MVAEEDQSFKGLVEHLHDAFQSYETLSELISDFYGWSHKKQGDQRHFGDDLQVLAKKSLCGNHLLI